VCAGDRECETWKGDAGTNACFVLEPEELIDALSSLPSDPPAVEREARILDWLDRDDGITISQAAAFSKQSELAKLREEVVHRALAVTRLGGIPTWLQSAHEAPEDGWRFAGQLHTLFSFYRPPETRGKDIVRDRHRLAGRTHFGAGLDCFGVDPICYFFLRETETRPEGWFLWQRQC
jgi:hypothetical protein